MKKTTIGGILLGIAITITVAYLVGCASPGYYNSAVTPQPTPLEQRSQFIGGSSESTGTICLPGYQKGGSVLPAGTSVYSYALFVYTTTETTRLASFYVSSINGGQVYDFKDCRQ